MSKSTFTILKQCLNCGNMFESQKRTTKYCSHKCNSQHYKLRKKLERKAEVEADTITQQKIRPKTNALNLELIKQKEFLTVKEVATLFGCSQKTVYRMIESNEINANNLSERLTRIRRKDIEQLFEQPRNKPKKTGTALSIEVCYLMNDIVEKYKVSRNTIYNYVKKHNIQRIKQDGITYYSKIDIDTLFNPV